MTSESTIPTVDLTAFSSPSTHSDADRLAAGQSFVAVLHRYGSAKVTGHGFTTDEINEAFRWNQRLFVLPYAEKMKAPHPPGPFPHRGYSGIDHYAVADTASTSTSSDRTTGSRKISDLKERYEVGSAHDDHEPNIWLPEATLPGFRAYATSLYKGLSSVGAILLKAISLGLEFTPQEDDALQHLASHRHSQLRLLHYPAILQARLAQDEVCTRMPAHNDWGAFTMLFQDGNGGLELQDPETGEFLRAELGEGALVVNVGDMLGRFTNDYSRSAVHRVAIPEVETVEEKGVPARRSMPFFVRPEPPHTVATLPRFVSAENPGNYEPVRFDEYGALVSKYHYQVGNI
ncbi:hypothetical protein CHGG_08439 [Chaetomium globosum CBS 148.51]|uniref:Fe2OG dioxygenase domain-containing protein n=1 Tax=Chaetomium globosum (strain ATCC 6205 / CBS 148.51 / DSM 1962 / NBRC 6347 / NRRL 1970) TaxID=306901 RepID=Q2GUB5_CHAGB|nr:uncharacterized protein CHGG_08439 [Chaetomium globosum CBS 148.51]EAQ84425.1 hypothetical protein CHGG_08439 [Chaetomium globosum CBS 148.51]